MCQWVMDMKNTSPTFEMTWLSAAERNIPVPSMSGCIAGSDKIEKMRDADASMSRDSVMNSSLTSCSFSPGNSVRMYHRTSRIQSPPSLPADFHLAPTLSPRPKRIDVSPDQVSGLKKRCNHSQQEGYEE